MIVTNHDSRAVTRTTYNPETMTLLVTFSDGNGFRYNDVPPAVHAALIEAASVGAYFNKHIRNQY